MYLHFIPYVNGFDLLTKAVLSVNELWPRTIIIDNRNDESLPNPNDPSCPWYKRVAVIKPIVSLNTAQTMNMMWRIAVEQECSFFTWMHNDGEALDGAGGKLIKFVEELTEPWGIVYTNYDVLAAYNVEAINLVGGWDALRFPYYFLDNDIAKAVESVGFPTLNSGLGDLVKHNNGASNTIHSDPVRNEVNRMTFSVCDQMFRKKWGL